MRRFSIGLVSTLTVGNPPAVKHGGGVMNQLSSSGQDSNWRKQESLVSARHSRDAGKQKTDVCSAGDSSLMSSSSSSSSAEKLVQVSMKSTRIHSSSSFSLNSGSWLEEVATSPTNILFSLWNIVKARLRLWLDSSIAEISEPCLQLTWWHRQEIKVQCFFSVGGEQESSSLKLNRKWLFLFVVSFFFFETSLALTPNPLSCFHHDVKPSSSPPRYPAVLCSSCTTLGKPHIWAL